MNLFAELFIPIVGYTFLLSLLLTPLSSVFVYIALGLAVILILMAATFVFLLIHDGVVAYRRYR